MQFLAVSLNCDSAIVRSDASMEWAEKTLLIRKNPLKQHMEVDIIDNIANCVIAAICTLLDSKKSYFSIRNTILAEIQKRMKEAII
ncbi:MAG: hypothetical protein sL5_00440 [Candidatus Mesenet longicola]|uniref:Uncharacterized protein n=1 Tax=Candidatus Mesenet longicola TaxID=1892558 RepID=A0A8J3HVF9_9RICK|nr:MAG: hypothetical protein sGL2_00520 [Candidatus Mesenet longicola]GHM59051.1 MAG: hypothetical protein sL5_00440 [Candidatus Mesenet longicola]